MLSARKVAVLGLSSAALIGAAPFALAAPTVCTVIPAGTPDVTIAVASNFYEPAQDLAASFIANDPAGSGKKIRVCHNSTGTLNTEVRTGTSGYALLLAADKKTPDDLVATAYVPSGATSDLYAKGIPVLFARNVTVPNVKSLMSAAPNGAAATISYVVAPATPINTTNAQMAAIADTVAAPYGKAAALILADMGITVSNTTVPAWVTSPLYANISLTFDGVALSPYNNTSGFVSKAQICSGINPSSPTYSYIAFTNAKYVLAQHGILINSGNSTQNTLGAAIRSYMLANSNPSFWSTFLTDHCYAPI